MQLAALGVHRVIAEEHWAREVKVGQAGEKDLAARVETVVQRRQNMLKPEMVFPKGKTWLFSVHRGLPELLGVVDEDVWHPDLSQDLPV